MADKKFAPLPDHPAPCLSIAKLPITLDRGMFNATIPQWIKGRKLAFQPVHVQLAWWGRAVHKNGTNRRNKAGSGRKPEMLATAKAGTTLDTFPKYLLLNADRFGDRPAMRHKDLGIWQGWTWKQQLEEVRAFAIGLSALGLKRGDRVAVVGSNRPRLYWTFAAVQSIGGIPVPVYADSVAEEMAYVLDHAEVRYAVVEDQEQVDKLLSIAEKVPSLTQIIYDEMRGLRDYDHTHLHAYDEVREKGLSLIAADPQEVSRWQASVAAGTGGDLGVILYTSGTTGPSKGAMMTHAHVYEYAYGVTEMLELPYDTTIHYILAHVHPFCESLELRDLTTGESVVKLEMKQVENQIGLSHTEHFESVEGLPLYKDHGYEMVSIYNNTSDKEQDAMAVMIFFLKDKTFDADAYLKGTGQQKS